MSALTTLSAIPSATYAGDTFLLEITDSDRTAPSWNYVFSFRCADGAIDITSTDNAQAHLFSVTPDVTLTWIPGTYSGVGVAVGPNGEKVTTWRGQLDVRDNLNNSPDGTDPRSWAKRCLDKIEAVIEGRAGRDILNSTIAGQALGRMTPEQLFTMRDRFAAEYRSELAAIDAEHGKTSRGHIGFLFTTPQ